MPDSPELIHDADLARLSTFALPARAAELVILERAEQLPALEPGARELLVLGGGSNTLFLGDWPGRVILNRLRGVTIETLDEQASLVHAAAGENWHQLVRHCLEQGLYGIENLIMIPGSVGAAPIQNIGAYGVELADTLVSVSAWDWHQQQRLVIPAAECGFGYRDSRFKSFDRGRFLITGISLRLSHRFAPRADYRSLADALAERPGPPSPRQLAAAIMRLRRHRLPDPARLANAGSFFKNPVLPEPRARLLLDRYPALPHWPLPDGQIKLAAGWMIEQLGFRGYRIGSVGVYANHALVLVNHGGANTSDLITLIERITRAVETEYDIQLEPEPQLMGQAPDRD